MTWLVINGATQQSRAYHLRRRRAAVAAMNRNIICSVMMLKGRSRAGSRWRHHGHRKIISCRHHRLYETASSAVWHAGDRPIKATGIMTNRHDVSLSAYMKRYRKQKHLCYRLLLEISCRALEGKRLTRAYETAKAATALLLWLCSEPASRDEQASIRRPRKRA